MSPVHGTVFEKTSALGTYFESAGMTIFMSSSVHKVGCLLEPSMPSTVAEAFFAALFQLYTCVLDETKLPWNFSLAS